MWEFKGRLKSHIISRFWFRQWGKGNGAFTEAGTTKIIQDVRIFFKPLQFSTVKGFDTNPLYKFSKHFEYEILTKPIMSDDWTIICLHNFPMKVESLHAYVYIYVLCAHM